MAINESVLNLVGNTPLVQIREDGFYADVFAKLESYNPAGSIKDRVAKALIEDAEKRGLIGRGGTVIEPTSGNTGIGLALVGSVKGYKVVLTMPDSMSRERIAMLENFGATVVLTDGKKGMQGAKDRAEEICKNTPNSFIAGQFSNPVNPQVHFNTTAPEIWSDLNGKVDVFVAGIGTGGTLSGVGRFLKQKNPEIKIIGVEPDGSPLISKGVSGQHKIQGIGANFVPDNFDGTFVDEVLTATDTDALLYKDFLNVKRGIFVGISSGASYSVARKLALKKENQGKNIVVVFPDSGDRYLSIR